MLLLMKAPIFLPWMLALDEESRARLDRFLELAAEAAQKPHPRPEQSDVLARKLLLTHTNKLL